MCCIKPWPATADTSEPLSLQPQQGELLTPSPALLRGEELSPAHSPSLPQAQLSLPCQGSHPKTCCTTPGSLLQPVGMPGDHNPSCPGFPAALSPKPPRQGNHRAPEPGWRQQRREASMAGHHQPQGQALLQDSVLCRALVPSLGQEVFVLLDVCPEVSSAPSCLEAFGTREGLITRGTFWQLLQQFC